MVMTVMIRFSSIFDSILRSRVLTRMNSIDDQDRPARNKHVTGTKSFVLLEVCPATERFAGNNNDSVALSEDSGVVYWYTNPIMICCTNLLDGFDNS